jgi:hypothetical protein
MATKKVKKFGRGGDILTGIGAALAGYGVYKELTRGKDEAKSRSGLTPPSDALDYRKKEEKKVEPETKEEVKAETKKDTSNVETSPVPNPVMERKALEVSKGRPEIGDAANDNIAVKKTKPAATLVKSNRAVNKSTSKNFVPDAASSPSKSVVFKPASDAAPAPVSTAKAKQAVAKAADSTASNSVPKGIDLKGTSKTVYGTDTTSVFQKRAAQERADKEAKAKKAAKDKANAEEFRNRPLQPMKKGGAVKKMASGGMARSSASKRADGCAIRGKTRA